MEINNFIFILKKSLKSELKHLVRKYQFLHQSSMIVDQTRDINVKYPSIDSLSTYFDDLNHEYSLVDSSGNIL